VIGFVVQLEFKTTLGWRPVVRYDTAHGFAHRDRYQSDGTVSRHEPLPVSHYNQAMNYAIKDVKTNWEDWIRDFQGKPA
jgi:hypothetical protein